MQYENLNRAANALYRKYFKMINSITLRYCRLNPVVEFSDFLSEGYLAAVDAIAKYNKKRGGERCKISNVFYWYIQKRFSKLCGINDKIVELRYPNGEVKIVSYYEFMRIKRSLDKSVNFLIKNRLYHFDFLREGKDYEGDGTGDDGRHRKKVMYSM